jgi:hypothetical protein
MVPNKLPGGAKASFHLSGKAAPVDATERDAYARNRQKMTGAIGSGGRERKGRGCLDFKLTHTSIESTNEILQPLYPTP